MFYFTSPTVRVVVCVTLCSLLADLGLHDSLEHSSE